jgi:hypothetical protein
MKALFILLAAILIAGCAHDGGVKAAGATQRKTAEGEGALAEALAGRVAGPPQDCISEPDLAGNQSFGRGVILFRSRTNDVLYVNRPPGGCVALNFGRAIKTTSPTTRLCRGDTVTVFDPVSGIEYGGCGLGEFTPYRSTR